MLMSTAMPGLGQTKITNGKPWWLTGIAAYGAMASGLVIHNSYLKTYSSYQVEEDPATRAALLHDTQQKQNVSNALIISSATVWIANIIWVAVIPNKYQSLQHVKLSLEQPIGPLEGTTLLTLRLNF